MPTPSINAKLAAIQARVQAARAARVQAVERYTTAAAESLATLVETTESQMAETLEAFTSAHEGDTLSFLEEGSAPAESEPESLEIPALNLSNEQLLQAL